MAVFVVEVTGKYSKGTDQKMIEKTEKALAKEFKNYVKNFGEKDPAAFKIKIAEIRKEENANS